MTKLGVAFWVGLVVVTGFTTFKVKYAVQDIEEELHRVRKHTVAEQQEIRVLAAEWTYLTQPERLAELNRRFGQLAPLGAKQLQPRIEDMPLRAPAPGDVVVAANTPPPAAQPVALPAGTVTAAPAAAPPAIASLAVVAPAATRPAAAIPTASRALAVAAATFIAPAHAASVPHPPVQLAKATPGSLDALIAQIATAR